MQNLQCFLREGWQWKAFFWGFVETPLMASLRPIKS